MSGGVIAVELGDPRCRGDDRGIGWPLRIEHAQRVLVERDLALRGEVAAVGLEVRLQRSNVSSAVVGFAQRVEQEGDPGEAERLVELPAEGDHLDVEQRILGAEHLDAHLVELAVATALWFLVAELRTGVPDLPRSQRPVLNESAAHRSRELGPKGDVPSALVDEVVHLLGDHIGGVTDALEHPQVFEHRRDHLAVACGLDDPGEHRDEPPPALRLRRQDVAHPGAGLEFRHSRPGYRPGLPGQPPLTAPGGAIRSIKTTSTGLPTSSTDALDKPSAGCTVPSTQIRRCTEPASSAPVGRAQT